MAKDNRIVNYGIRTLVDENQNRKARVLGGNPETLDDDLDEIAGMYSQEQLDRLVQKGVLGGDWTSSESGEITNEPPTEAALSKMNVADLTAAAESEGVSFDEGATKKDIVEAILSNREN